MISLKECFLNYFQLLSSKQKKIWTYLQWYSKKYRHVFPSHQTIADAVGCHRDTVIEAIKKFISLGWLSSIKRCFRSNLYFMADELIDIDVSKSETFYRQKNPDIYQDPTQIPTENPTQNPTLYNNVLKGVNERYTQKPEIVQHVKCNEVEHILKSIGICGKDLWCLARYSLSIVSRAIEDFKTRTSKERIRNLPAWLTSRCKSYC